MNVFSCHSQSFADAKIFAVYHTSSVVPSVVLLYEMQRWCRRYKASIYYTTGSYYEKLATVLLYWLYVSFFVVHSSTIGYHTSNIPLLYHVLLLYYNSQ